MTMTPVEIALIVLAALILGFSKTGISGGGVLVVPLLASVFAGKTSMGVMLPMLIFGDVLATAYHGRRVHLPTLLKLLPWVMPGLVGGYFALDAIPSAWMARSLGALVLVMLGLRIAQVKAGPRFAEHIPRRWWFSAVMGLLAGFATMVGNLAGTIMTVYLLSMGADKKRFMGTGTWYYLIVNLIKVPLYIRLGLFSAETLAVDLRAAPVILLGGAAGVLVFRKIPQEWFERIVLVLAAVAAVRLLFL